MTEDKERIVKKEKQTHNSKVVLQTVAYTAAIASAHWIWSKRVDEVVLEPYLDEVFHVRQAQKYCERDWTWDPKITTPSGLYVLSLAYHSIPRLACNTTLLRSINGLLLSTTLFVNAFMCRDAISSRQYPQVETDPRERRRRLQRLSADLHTAFNIALFPPLFFFSALYYTDVASTAFTLAFINLYFRRSRVTSAEIYVTLLTNAVVEGFISKGKGPIVMLIIFTVGQLGPAVHTPDPKTPMSSPAKNSSKSGFLRTTGWPDLILFGYGVLAICLRQTNIFWVTVFPAGLSLASYLQSQRESQNNSLGEVLQASWKDQTIYDPLSSKALLHDYFKVPISIAVAWSSLLTSSRRSLSDRIGLITGRFGAYIMVLALFAAFVVWNGGVVLGDKSNHVATLHFPQMLYIWPFIVFFSIPLLLPAILGALLPKSYLPTFLQPFVRSALPNHTSKFVASATILTLTLTAIDRNTIIHPFTLADNRHYIFYVFRILLAHPTIKYLAALVYLICAWAALRALGVPSSTTTPQTPKPTKGPSAPHNGAPQTDTSHGEQPVSTIAVWLLTSTLCLVTAPLVEPRYFILPWVTWRLMLPGHQECDSFPPRALDSSGTTENQQKPLHSERKASEKVISSDARPQQPAPSSSSSSSSSAVGRRPGGILDNVFPRHGDWRLRLETMWFLGINAVTGYVFLYRGFEWPQEPGIVQRFMW